MAAETELSTAVACVVICTLTATLGHTFEQDQFHEELLIKPLQTGHVYAQFKFTTLWNVSLISGQSFSHYNLFPKSLGQVISKYSVQELHLSLTQGLWRHDKWGYPVNSAPPGAQLWVWFQQSTKSVDDSWAGLVNALSGLFCASLNFVDVTNTITPKLSFRPGGIAQDSYSRSQKYLRYASLPREIVCTENLTPWKKLLPCDSKAGLSTVFHAGHLYNANYNSISVDLRPVCSDFPACISPALELTQSLDVVFEPPVHNRGKQDWTLASLFDRPLLGACPLASISKVYVDLSVNSTSNPLQMTPNPTETLTVTSGETSSPMAVYDLKTITKPSVNIAMKWTGKVQYSSVKPPPLYAHRFLSGYGQEKGGITCHLYNNDPVNSIRVVYLETVPWFVRLYLHTLQVSNSVKLITPEKKLFTPGRDRGNPYTLELVLTLPPASVTSLSIQFEKACLKWTEHPPDANLGFHIGSAVITAMMPSSANYTSPDQHQSLLGDSFKEEPKEGGFFLRLYTEPLLIQLPTPDFSMPYNVICLACTVVAIGFGSLHNLTTRRFGVSDKKKGGLLRRILDKLRRTKPEDDKKDDKKNEKSEEEEVEEDTEKTDSSSKKDR